MLTTVVSLSRTMRCLKSGQSSVKVSYSPPSPQMCSSYRSFCARREACQRIATEAMSIIEQWVTYQPVQCRLHLGERLAQVVHFEPVASSSSGWRQRRNEGTGESGANTDPAPATLTSTLCISALTISLRRSFWLRSHRYAIGVKPRREQLRRGLRAASQASALAFVHSRPAHAADGGLNSHMLHPDALVI